MRADRIQTKSSSFLLCLQNELPEVQSDPNSKPALSCPPPPFQVTGGTKASVPIALWTSYRKSQGNSVFVLFPFPNGSQVPVAKPYSFNNNNDSPLERWRSFPVAKFGILISVGVFPPWHFVAKGILMKVCFVSLVFFFRGGEGGSGERLDMRKIEINKIKSKILKCPRATYCTRVNSSAQYCR